MYLMHLLLLIPQNRILRVAIFFAFLFTSNFQSLCINLGEIMKKYTALISGPIYSDKL